MFIYIFASSLKSLSVELSSTLFLDVVYLIDTLYYIGFVSADAVSVTDRVIDWKFNNLDTDHNNKITRKEISVLKKLTENLVQPKACARRFTKYCDLDADKKISRSEWSVCLGVDINSKLERII